MSFQKNKKTIPLLFLNLMYFFVKNIDNYDFFYRLQQDVNVISGEEQRVGAKIQQIYRWQSLTHTQIREKIY